MIVSKRFLRNFSSEIRFQHVIAGRIAILSLSGPLGSMDIATVHLASGNFPTLRCEQLRALACSIRPANRSHTILSGDWNFILESGDR